jgi:hypothetical protein
MLARILSLYGNMCFYLEYYVFKPVCRTWLYCPTLCKRALEETFIYI